MLDFQVNSSKIDIRMASHTETKRLETVELENYLEILTETYIGDPEKLTELREFISTLNDIDKTILYLKILGYSSREIGEELGYTKRRINQRLKKIRKKAREWIG
jgi:RNA polymerase sigma factor (sigma-70 family)